MDTEQLEFTPDPSEIIQENTWVILKRGLVLKAIKVTANKKDMFERMAFYSSDLIGKQYNTLWQVNKQGRLQPLDYVPDNESYNIENDLEEVQLDNRNLVDNAQASQKLDREDIVQLKKEGASGQTIVKMIAENSANYENKNKFSKNKFINKKTKKHVKYFCVLKSSVRLLNSCFEYRSPGQVQFLSSEIVSLMCNNLNIHPGTKFGVVENSSGLNAGNILYKGGKVISFYDGNIGQGRYASELLNIDITEIDPETGKFNDRLVMFPLNKVGKLLKHYRSYTSYFNVPLDPDTESPYDLNKVYEINQEKEVTARRFRQSKSIIVNIEALKSLNVDLDVNAGEDETSPAVLKPSLDGLLLCSKYHPSSLIPLLYLVKPSRPFSVFSLTKEPLMDMFMNLQQSNIAILLEIKEIFFRQIQVLPNRTHPEMFMKGMRGHVLTGIRVDNMDVSL